MNGDEPCSPADEDMLISDCEESSDDLQSAVCSESGNFDYSRDSLKQIDSNDVMGGEKNLKGAFVGDVEVADGVLNGEGATLGSRANYPWSESSIMHRKKLILDVDIVSDFLIGESCWNCHRKEPEGVESNGLADCYDLGLKKCSSILFKTTRKFSNLSAQVLERALLKGQCNPKSVQALSLLLVSAKSNNKTKTHMACFHLETSLE